MSKASKMASDLSQDIARRFRVEGAELYLVGGAVREELLGRTDTDLDFATSALPNQTAHILESLDRGRTYRQGERYGTVGFKDDSVTVEVTTYRGERYRPGSRKPDVSFGKSLQDDLSRRDFTINAMARDPLSRQIIDPFGGAHDLEVGVIRAVGDPAERFREDPLRLLRGIRFAARLGFSIESATGSAMLEVASDLHLISRERIRDEYSAMLLGPAPVQTLALLRDSTLLFHSVPELLELDRMPDHGPKHPLSLWDHTMRVVAGVPADLRLRWAALLHDIAKPATRTVESDGRPRFFQHEEMGAGMTRSILASLRYNHAEIRDAVQLVQSHMQLHAYTKEWSDGAVRRLMLRLGPLLADAILLARADAAGHPLQGRGRNAPKLDHLQLRIDELRQDATVPPKSPLNGNELMERYRLPPGPWIAKVKDALLDEEIEGTLDPRDLERAWWIADATVGADTMSGE